VQLPRFVLPLNYRALSIARHRVAGVFSQAPLLFFAVVIGVAVMFKIGIGWMQSGVTAEPETPSVAKTSHEDPRAAASVSFQADPAAQPLPATTSTAGAGAVLADPTSTTGTSPRRHKHHPRSR
jgi:hypothetical protein